MVVVACLFFKYATTAIWTRGMGDVVPHVL